MRTLNGLYERSYIIYTLLIKSTYLVILVIQLFTDLKAFERRLTEVITCLRPGTIRWRIILVTASICTAIGAWQWINDPLTSASQVSFLDSLINHLFFSISSLFLGEQKFRINYV